MITSHPLVSAMMLTIPGREQMAQVAIQCFLNQTYPNRELVILNQTGKPICVTGPIQISNQYCAMRQIMYNESPIPLGALRNYTQARCDGEIIMFWDDDDWSSPNRMESQVINSTKGFVTMFRRQLRFNLLNGDSCGVDWPSGIYGTMSFFNDKTPCFPAYAKGSDEHFVNRVFGDNRIVIDNDAREHVRNYHGGNVWDEEHIMQPHSSRLVTNEERTFLIHEILPLYPDLKQSIQNAK